MMAGVSVLPVSTLIPQTTGMSCGPPKALMVQLVFTASIQEFDLDLTDIQARGRFDSVLSIWVDNLVRTLSGDIAQTSNQPVFVTFDNSQQTISIPPNSQGYFDVIAANPTSIRITGNFDNSLFPGSGTTVGFLNFRTGTEVTSFVFVG